MPKAAALNTGRDLIRIYGCFGCHKIPGYENIRKVGPDLSTVSGKADQGLGSEVARESEGVQVAGPHAAVLVEQQQQRAHGKAPIGTSETPRKSTRSPNTSGRSPNRRNCPLDRPTAIAATGKQIVETVGCFGCHAIGPIQEVANQSQIRRRHGYNLENQGSKVTAVLDLQLGEGSDTGLAGNQDAEPAIDR